MYYFKITCHEGKWNVKTKINIKKTAFIKARNHKEALGKALYKKAQDPKVEMLWTIGSGHETKGPQHAEGIYQQYYYCDQIYNDPICRNCPFLRNMASKNADRGDYECMIDDGAVHDRDRICRNGKFEYRG